jgi:hypothetical protein
MAMGLHLARSRSHGVKRRGAGREGGRVDPNIYIYKEKRKEYTNHIFLDLSKVVSAGERQQRKKMKISSNFIFFIILAMTS